MTCALCNGCRKQGVETTSERERILRTILAEYPGAKRVVLFGSRARGTAVDSSDWDLLIVTPTDLRPAERGARLRLALRDIEAGFDLIVVTPQEFERLRRWSSSVVAQAAKDGEHLYEAA